MKSIKVAIIDEEFTRALLFYLNNTPLLRKDTNQFCSVLERLAFVEKNDVDVYNFLNLKQNNGTLEKVKD